MTRQAGDPWEIEINALRAENERLKRENVALRDALGANHPLTMRHALWG